MSLEIWHHLQKRWISRWSTSRRVRFSVSSDHTSCSGSSVDYVFDGTAPPYTPAAVTNPLQVYGKMKRDGEVEVLKTGKDGASVVVLRVPVL
jgi:hypothetical protein